jgi:thiamine biosynthesis protein ThiS
MAVTIALNGEPYELPAPTTIAGLLARLGIDPRTVAVELDRVVIRRQRYAEIEVVDGAEVEIVAFVGGGSGVKSCVKLKVKSLKSGGPILTAALSVGDRGRQCL